jgi:L-lactate utilization protein LutB
MSDTDVSAELCAFYEARSKVVIRNLAEKNMTGYFVPDRKSACDLVMELVAPGATVGRGDSVTLNQIGFVDEVIKRGENRLINPVETDAEGLNLPRGERRKLQREALTCDVFVTGTNAITLGGSIVSVDGAGNRVAAMMFGPRKLIVVAGGNKIVTDVDEALHRIRNEVWFINALRHQAKHQHVAPCACIEEGRWMDCTHAWRSVRKTAIIDGSQPPEKERIKVVLIGERLGL